MLKRWIKNTKIESNLIKEKTRKYLVISTIINLATILKSMGSVI